MYDDPTPAWEAWYNQSPFLHSIWQIGLIIFCSVIAYYFGKEILIQRHSENKREVISLGTWKSIVVCGAILTIFYTEFMREPKFDDDLYCAKVKHYNPGTGTTSIYRLTVEVYENRIKSIYFNNGGTLDDSHFTPPKFSPRGVATIVDERGYTYTVSNLIKGDCNDLLE